MLRTAGLKGRDLDASSQVNLRKEKEQKEKKKKQKNERKSQNPPPVSLFNAEATLGL